MKADFDVITACLAGKVRGAVKNRPFLYGARLADQQRKNATFV